MSSKRFPQPEPIEQTSTLYLHGPHAQAVSGLLPGSSVNVAGSGTLQHVSSEKTGGLVTHHATVTMKKLKRASAGRKARRLAIATVRAGAKTATESRMEAARGPRGKKTPAEMSLERKRGVNPRKGD